MKPVSMVIASLVMSSIGRSAPHSDSWKLVRTEDSPISGVRHANAMSVGDFDRNGRLDLVVLGGDPGQLLVLMNQSSGRFAPSAQGVLAAGAGASGLAAGDLDGNGSSDLVVSHHDDFEILVLLSAGDGSFRPAPGSPVIAASQGTPHSHNIALADANGDGKLDIVQAQSEENWILILLGDGKGSFSAAPGSPFMAGEHPYTIVIADFDGDGAADFAAPDAEGKDLTVGLGSREGRFTAAPGSRSMLSGRGLGLATGDLNGDGHVDLVVNYDDEPTLEVMLGDGSGLFQALPEKLAGPGRCYGQMIADLNLDGIADVAAPCIDAEAVAVWLGQSGTRCGFQRTDCETPGTDSQVMAIADLNEDGLLDVATAGWEQSTISILLGRALGQDR